MNASESWFHFCSAAVAHLSNLFNRTIYLFRLVCDGDKFEVIYTPKEIPLNLWPSGSADEEGAHANNCVAASTINFAPNGIFNLPHVHGARNAPDATATVVAEVTSRSPLLFIDDQNEQKPVRKHFKLLNTKANASFKRSRFQSLEFLNRLAAASPSQSSDSLQHAHNGYARENSEPNDDTSPDFVEPTTRKRYRAHNGSVDYNALNYNSKNPPEDGPCAEHLNEPEKCSHTFFRAVCFRFLPFHVVKSLICRLTRSRFLPTQTAATLCSNIFSNSLSQAPTQSLIRM